jgi:type IV pilus assembly protein PilB
LRPVLTSAARDDSLDSSLSALRWVPLGTLLESAGLLTPEQLASALSAKEQTGQRLGEILVELGFVTNRQIAGALAEQYGLELLDLAHTEIDPAAVAMLPEHVARRSQALPIRFISEDVLLLAVADPTNLRIADDLGLALGSSFRLAVVDPDELDVVLDRVYRRRIELSVSDAEPEGFEAPRLEDIQDMASSAPTINLVNSFLTRAVEDGASDVHVEPHPDELLVRARVDGVMRQLAALPKHMQAAVTTRLKIMGGLDIAERRAPQDGRVSVRFGEEPIDLRIAVLPTTDGEQVVLRLLNRREHRLTLAESGMSPETVEIFSRAIDQPFGVIVVCGPTGSGKTTTLYAALDQLNDPARVLMTIEDPVEQQIKGVNQIDINPRAGLTFARGLRTILRSDPDVLLVGEIRDEETAQIAVRAGITGHLVLTTLHTHTAAGAIVRLRDMGVETGLLANALHCIVAQRLVRRLCSECKQPYSAPEKELGLKGSGKVTLYRAGRCVKCGSTGYSGRVAIHEVMPIHGEIRGLIEQSAGEIFKSAVRHGMKTLKEDGLRVCLEGLTSVDEIRRVTGDRLA